MHMNAPVARSSAQQLQAPRCAAPLQGAVKRCRGPVHCCTRQARVPVGHSSTDSSSRQPELALELLTITKVSSAEDWAVIWQVSELLADVFQTGSHGAAGNMDSTTTTTAESHSPGKPRRSVSHWLYRVNAMLYALLLHSQPGCRQLTIVARAGDNGHAGGSGNTGSSSSPKQKEPAAIMGACSLTSRQAESEFAGPEFSISTQYALVNNMAVAPTARRQGIAQLLMGACEAAAVQLMEPRPRFMALLCYKDNEAAIRLYQSSGFEERTEWQDTQWLKDAERGQPGKPKRLLMVKTLSPPARPM